MVPFVFNSRALANVPLNLCFEHALPALQTRKASTLKEPKELHPDDHKQHNFHVFVCAVKGEFLSGEWSGEVIQLGYASQIKGLNKKYQLNFQPPFLDVFKINTFHKSQQQNCSQVRQDS